MNTRQKDFIRKLCSSAENHSEWIAVMRFGINTLMEDQQFLIELVITEAKQLKEDECFGIEEKVKNGLVPSELPLHILGIFNDLGLTITPTAESIR